MALDLNEAETDEDGSILLPAWFSERMMHDEWKFGLLLDTGMIIGIQYIEKITKDAAGDLWLDVRLLDKDDLGIMPKWWGGIRLLVSPSDRTTATIKASHIVAAFELIDS